jgi:hypothetical protein
LDRVAVRFGRWYMPVEDTVPTWRKKRYGRCRVCRKFGQLTREHVPPASAFNDRGYLSYYVDQVEEAERGWKARKIGAHGVFVFTLCEKCNNKTGTAYGGAYVDFVRAFADVATPANAGAKVEVEVKNLFPARVVKQAASMILSTSEPISSLGDYERVWNPLLDSTPSPPPEEAFSRLPDPEGLRNAYDGLRAFVRKRDAKGLPAGVRLYAYAVANSGSGVRTGIMASGKRSTNKYVWLVVVGLWPIHWVLVLDGEPHEELLDVTDWADVGYKVRRGQMVTIPCYWTVGRYPMDFRPPGEVMRDGFTSRMRRAGLPLEPGMDKDEMFRAAVSFARRRAKWTREGYLMAEFKSGVYFEAEGRRGWLEGITRDEAREVLKRKLAETAESPALDVGTE